MPINSEAVIELRRRESLTQSKLASILNVTPTTIYNYEHNNPPSVDGMDKIYKFALERGHRDLSFYIPPKSS